MATLVFSSIGTMLGGPVGGAIGSLVGRQFDTALFGSSPRQGPRLKELGVTTSSYGQILPRHFGRMRVAGSMIWATELVEHSETQGGGNGSPSLTSYSYTANFAVALASRKIQAIGRIWADGKLLRGRANDLKVAGTMRIHCGTGDQLPDPLIIAAEGEERCPAYRGLAYVVFEDLDLSEFYNRIPSLTFEVIADEHFDLQAIIGEVVPGADASVVLDGIEGYTSEGSPAVDLQAFDQIMPLEIHAGGDSIVIAPERRQSAAILLREPTVAEEDDDFGSATGYARHRSPPTEQPPAILRYYDLDRDYQPGAQRATGKPWGAEPGAIDFPGALDAATARALIERTARRIDWTRDRISWRTSELDAAVAPGTLVALPGIPGHWRVREWEWRDNGVELGLERALPSGADSTGLPGSDPGRANAPLDVEPGETRIVAFEMLLQNNQTPHSKPGIYAAVCGTSAHWRGVALYADLGGGALQPLGSTGHTQAVIGYTRNVLPAAHPLLVDRASHLIVSLANPAMQLASASMRQIAEGANLALVGEEVVQFCRAMPLGEGTWRLEGLLRGRGGTEAFIGAHRQNDTFALLGSGLVPLDLEPGQPGLDRHVVAIGRGDKAPAISPIFLRGAAMRPLSPVHPRKALLDDGSCLFSWTRRARGGWQWRDGVDVPLIEEAERYLVSLGPLDAPVATWSTDVPRLQISASELARMTASAPGAVLQVRQQGTHAISLPLALCTLP